jgi:heptaprenyl diphosphate synthase
MGLANIFSLVALIMYSPLEAFAVVIVRTLLGAIFAGNVSMLLYSFTGGMVSMGLSALFLYIVYPKISIMAISILSACAHNMVQNIMFVFISASTLAFSYAPYLMLLGIVSGAIVGGVTMLIFKKVPLSVFEKVTYKKIVKDD